MTVLLTVVLCVALMYIIPAHSDTSRPDEYVPCEKGWYFFRDKCYRAEGREPSERLSWHDALAKCKSYGADLASIHSKEEQDFVTAYLVLNVTYWCWIGLNDLEKSKDFKWSDGSAYNYHNFHKDNPSHVYEGEPENCVQIFMDPEPLGEWNDKNCNAEDAFICEKNTNPKESSPNPMYCSADEGGGLKNKNSCYHVVSDRMSWEYAESHCMNHYNGHLITIHDKMEDFFLDLAIRIPGTEDEIWIGIKKSDHQLQHMWTSGWYVSYEGFGRKRWRFSDGPCVSRKGKESWNSISCTTQLPFICEVSKDNPPVLKPPPVGAHCPDNYYWRDLGGEYCYYIDPTSLLSYFSANNNCIRKGGHLASLHSHEESRILQPFYLYKQKSIFISLQRQRVDSDTFEWTDGSELDYQNWNDNEPNNAEEKCVEILIRTMKWNDVSCDNKAGFICSVKKIIPESSYVDDSTTVEADSTFPDSSVSYETTSIQTDIVSTNNHHSHPLKTAYSCEHNELDIGCDEGKVIHLIRANYGRSNISICNDIGEVDINVNCFAYKSFRILQEKCSQEQSCSVRASNEIFGDPCPGTVKYLEVQYECVSPNYFYSHPLITTYFCEHSKLDIGCDEGKVIHLFRANYGRSCVCMCNDIEEVDLNVSCFASNSFLIMQERCHQKQSCSIWFTYGPFGDPCVGTVKYLEVQYECVSLPDSSVSYETTSIKTDIAATNYHYSYPLKTIYACEHNVLYIRCDEGKVIHLIRANYGRSNISMCNDIGQVDMNVSCFSFRSFIIMQEKCSQQQSCSIIASDKIPDPCPGTAKYLDVQYQCVSPNYFYSHPLITTYSCEHSKLDIGCDEGKVIHLIRANYGRSCVCMCNDIEEVNMNVSCYALNSFHIVQERCDQKQSCSVRASNEIFGDPCRGTVKYLEVQYQCVSHSSDFYETTSIQTDISTTVSDSSVVYETTSIQSDISTMSTLDDEKPLNKTSQKQITNEALTAGGIFGIVSGTLVITIIIGVILYYLKPVKVIQPKLIEIDDL